MNDGVIMTGRRCHLVNDVGDDGASRSGVGLARLLRALPGAADSLSGVSSGGWWVVACEWRAGEDGGVAAGLVAAASQATDSVLSRRWFESGNCVEEL